jgi:regulator of sigma E protease
VFELLWNIVFFVIGLSILIAFHEYGHFWTARKCGVIVQIFKIGFGKTIWKRVGRDGVSYEIGSIPLGGYVKMLDSRNESISSAQQAFAFDKQTVGKRAAILLAGPMANFILAIFIFWLMFMIGKNELIPRVGDISENSPFSNAEIQSGDHLKRINGKSVETWQDFYLEALNLVGSEERIAIEIKRNGYLDTVKYVTISEWKTIDGTPDILDSFGFTVYKPSLLSEIGRVEASSPAEKAGIRLGDRLLTIDGYDVSSWNNLVKVVSDRPSKLIDLTFSRQGTNQTVSFSLEEKIRKDRKVGVIGLSPKVSDEYLANFQVVKYGAIDAFEQGIKHTVELIELSWSMLSKLFTGLLSIKNLAGPASIADGAGTNAKLGFAYFLGFLGMISVNLGFVNLLPIPMLDGGHLVFLGIEKIKGSTLSDKVQETALKVGFGIVVTIMLIAVMNDISRYS